jgi:hypothetical protein
MREIAKQLTAVIETAARPLGEIGDAEAAKPALAGGWSAKQVIGHLIDSASNNHQRFVRAALQGSLEFPNYDQAACVRVEAFQEARWEMLVEAWRALNRLLAHVLAHLPAEAAAAPCRIGDEEAIPLETVARRYLDHMRHHLGQLGLVT